MLLRSLDVARLAGKGDGFIMDRRSPDLNECRQPPLVTRRFSNYFSMPERRRIVALVRRMVLKKLGLRRAAKKMKRCDDLLTMAVDKEDRAGL